MLKRISYGACIMAFVGSLCAMQPREPYLNIWNNTETTITLKGTYIDGTPLAEQTIAPKKTIGVPMPQNLDQLVVISAAPTTLYGRLFGTPVATPIYDANAKETFKAAQRAYKDVKIEITPSTQPGVNVGLSQVPRTDIVAVVLYDYFPAVKRAHESGQPILPYYFLDLNQGASDQEIEEAYRTKRQQFIHLLETTTPETNEVYRDALKALELAYQMVKFINDKIVVALDTYEPPVALAAAAAPATN